MDPKLLERVCNAPGVCGYEDEAQDVAMDVLLGCCDEVRRDRLGNVIGLRKATRPPAGGKRPLRVLLGAHVDEIGMMVKHIGGDGFIRFQPMGGLNAQVLESQRVVIHGRKRVRGVVVPKPGKGKDKPAALEDLLIDTGLPPKALARRVDVGDIVTFDADVSRLNDKTYVGRNFDDRVGTYCLLEAMRQVGGTAVDVYAVSSVQEEVGLRGMRVAAYAAEPDIGIAVDGSLSWGAYAGKHDNLCGLGEGTGIYLVDRLTIGHRQLLQFLFDLCKRFKIPHQKNIGGGTDAAAIQQSRGGVVSTTIGAPVRYMHSTVQLCHADDMDATVKLLTKFMEHAHKFAPDEKVRRGKQAARGRRAGKR
jgi:endoglucanase